MGDYGGIAGRGGFVSGVGVSGTVISNGDGAGIAH